MILRVKLWTAKHSGRPTVTDRHVTPRLGSLQTTSFIQVTCRRSSGTYFSRTLTGVGQKTALLFTHVRSRRGARALKAFVWTLCMINGSCLCRQNANKCVGEALSPRDNDEELSLRRVSVCEGGLSNTDRGTGKAAIL